MTDDNYTVFRECLSSAIVARSEGKPSTKRRPKAKRNGRREIPSTTNNSTERADPEELAEFIDVHAPTRSEPDRPNNSVKFIAAETFASFPNPVQTISYAALQHDTSLNVYVPPDPDTPLDSSVLESICATIPVTVTDTLAVYGLMPDAADFLEFISPVLTEYITSVTTGPPAWAATRADACEICERDWIPLSYHHLIPRGVHAKVVKKGWHDEWMLNSVAWLCRACHSFVHRMASNEELAREWFTVDRILEREDVRSWANWVGRVRWKAR